MLSKVQRKGVQGRRGSAWSNTGSCQGTVLGNCDEELVVVFVVCKEEDPGHGEFCLANQRNAVSIPRTFLWYLLVPTQ